MTGKRDVTIKISEELEKKLDDKSKELGFNSISEYIEYVLEQVIIEDGSGESQDDDEDEEDVKERLKKLGYI